MMNDVSAIITVKGYLSFYLSESKDVSLTAVLEEYCVLGRFETP
jgi:hypothetical protein